MASSSGSWFLSLCRSVCTISRCPHVSCRTLDSGAVIFGRGGSHRYLVGRVALVFKGLPQSACRCHDMLVYQTWLPPLNRAPFACRIKAQFSDAFSNTCPVGKDQRSVSISEAPPDKFSLSGVSARCFTPRLFVAKHEETWQKQLLSRACSNRVQSVQWPCSMCSLR